MNLEFVELGDGRKLRIGPGIVAICGFDAAGNSVPLMLGENGAPALAAGAATETTLADHRTKSFGLNGGKYVTGTAANSGDTWVAIQALEDTVIASMTATGITGAALSTIPLPAGASIYGTITAFTLTSGKVIAYKA